jgi:hypothetical protein
VSRRVLIVVMLGLLATPAFAEDVVTYQAEGDAPAAAADARVMALDAAFARAVTTALGELVAGDVRTARKGELDREIVARARLWVAKFSVTKDETADGRRELSVNVKIDRDKLRARLAELRIATRSAVPGSGDLLTPQQRTATILLRITQAGGVRAVYGQGAENELPGVTSLTTLLRNAGFAVRRAPATGPAARGEGELPLGDDEADALAAQANAEVMAIAGVTVGPPVPVRGIAASASLVTAYVRVVERKDRKMIGQAAGIAAARGEDAGYAVDRALTGAAVDALPRPPTKLGQPATFSGDDVPVGEPGVVLVRLAARTPFSMVLATQKYLAGAKGVRAATLRRLSPNGWVLGVATSDSVEQIARIAKKPAASDTSASVKIVGNVVELSLSGAP